MTTAKGRMLALAHTPLPEAVAAPAPSPVLIVYVRPLADARRFEERLETVARRFGERVQLVRARAADLGRLVHERLFVSVGAPNLVLLRAGRVVGRAVGDLPARDLERLVRDGIERPRAT
jgi:hypothetical protein